MTHHHVVQTTLIPASQVKAFILQKGKIFHDFLSYIQVFNGWLHCCKEIQKVGIVWFSKLFILFQAILSGSVHTEYVSIFETSIQAQIKNQLAFTKTAEITSCGMIFIGLNCSNFHQRNKVKIEKIRINQII